MIILSIIAAIMTCALMSYGLGTIDGKIFERAPRVEVLRQLTISMTVISAVCFAMASLIMKISGAST